MSKLENACDAFKRVDLELVQSSRGSHNYMTMLRVLSHVGW